MINTALSKRPEVTANVGIHHMGAVPDLELLRFLPDVHRVHISHMFDLKAPEGIGFLNPRLKSLRLAERVVGSWDLSLLDRFTELTELDFGGRVRNIDAISRHRALVRLSVESVSKFDPEILVPVQSLRSVRLGLGSVTSIEPLARLGSLRYLEIWRSLGLASLAPLSGCSAIEEFYLDSLPRVTRLPRMEGLRHLRSMTLRGMKGLKSLSGLNAAPALETLELDEARHLKPDDLVPLKEHPTLQRVHYWLGSRKRQDAALRIIPCSDGNLPTLRNASIEELSKSNSRGPGDGSSVAVARRTKR